MYKVEYLPAALGDLKGAVTYIAQDLGSPQAAGELAQKIVDAGEILSSMPYRKRVYHAAGPLAHEYRALCVDNYLMFYWVDEERRIVTIARVIYRRTDAAAKLRVIE